MVFLELQPKLERMARRQAGYREWLAADMIGEALQRMPRICELWLRRTDEKSLHDCVINNLSYYFFKARRRHDRLTKKHAKEAKLGIQDWDAATHPLESRLDDVDQVQSILDKMSEYDQWLLLVHDGHGLSFRAMGEMCGRSKDTVRIDYIEALARAREAAGA